MYSLLIAWWCLCHAFKNISFYVGTFYVRPTLPHDFPTCLLRFASVVSRSEEFWFSSIVFPWAGIKDFGSCDICLLICRFNVTCAEHFGSRPFVCQVLLVSCLPEAGLGWRLSSIVSPSLSDCLFVLVVVRFLIAACLYILLSLLRMT